MEALLEKLSDTSLAAAVRESTMLFPWFESVHVLALAIVVGSIAIIDLRLLGVASRNHPVRKLLKDILPITWTSFVIAAFTGIVLFASQAPYYADKFPLQMKLLLLLLAGVNMLIFHTTTIRTLDQWDTAERTPVGARIAGGSSLVLWAGVVIFGRWIGFV